MFIREDDRRAPNVHLVTASVRDGRRCSKCLHPGQHAAGPLGIQRLHRRLVNGWPARLVRIVSLNAWGAALYDALIEWLPSCGADTICLQNSPEHWGLTAGPTFADSERALPHRCEVVWLRTVSQASDRRGTARACKDVHVVRHEGDVHIFGAQVRV